jgi:GNAT superfamily N-acetyltransferase
MGSIRTGNRTWTLHSGLDAHGTYLSCAGRRADAPEPRHDDAGWVWLTGEPSADLNLAGVLAGPNAERALLDVIAAVSDANVPAMMLLEDARALGGVLDAHGLSVATEMPILLWADRSPIVAEPDITVRAVRSPRDVEIANDLVGAAFSLDAAMTRSTYPADIGNPEIPMQLWLAERDGVPVGSGTSILADGHVGIFSMATPKAYEGQGVGRSVLAAIHEYGLREGATAFILGATEAGYPLYLKVGYRVLGHVGIVLTGESTQFSAP